MKLLTFQHLWKIFVTLKITYIDLEYYSVNNFLVKLYIAMKWKNGENLRALISRRDNFKEILFRYDV